MDVYQLTGKGEQLAHSYRSPRSPEWAVIHYLYRHGAATKEMVYENVPSASSSTLAKLHIKGIISGGRGSGI